MVKACCLVLQSNVSVKVSAIVFAAQLHTTRQAMAKQKSGYAYQEKIWFGVVEYTDQNGKRQKIKRRASGQGQAQEIAVELLRKLTADGAKISKARTTVICELGSWYARVTYTDEGGNRRNVKRQAENKTEAKEEIKRILRELDEHGEKALDGSQMSFNDLADYYEKTYLIPAQYIDGRKVAGRRSYRQALTLLGYLRDHFGRRKLRSITHGDIERFRTKRLATGTVRGQQRSITSVNRELQLMRAIFNVASREGWIIKNPFTSGQSLISIADEHKRERILTWEEEARLLAACTGRRAHLRPIIVCALDTGMRHGEILKLNWSDIDFESRIIRVRAFNTKTMRERQIAMTERLTQELQSLFEKSTMESETLVFGIEDNVKRSFTGIRKDAGLADVRFHDLRHTHATRLVAAHIPISEVGRILGHTQVNTTYRYVNANVETARRAAAAIDDFNRLQQESKVSLIQ